MFTSTTFFLIAIAIPLQDCPECQTCPQTPQVNILDMQAVQREGITAAVRSLENQVQTLSANSGQRVWLSATHPDKDQQSAVINLSDAMENDGILTRTYLALAVAELKLITLPCCSGCCSEADKKKRLRHAEAILYAIDERGLDHQDLRVYRVLQAGVNETLREELTQLKSTPAPMTGYACYPARKRRLIGILTCGTKCR